MFLWVCLGLCVLLQLGYTIYVAPYPCVDLNGTTCELQYGCSYNVNQDLCLCAPTNPRVDVIFIVDCTQQPPSANMLTQSIFDTMINGAIDFIKTCLLFFCFFVCVALYLLCVFRACFFFLIAGKLSFHKTPNICLGKYKTTIEKNSQKKD